ncbi:lipoprotein [Rhodocytophaga aerolata]
MRKSLMGISIILVLAGCGMHQNDIAILPMSNCP